MECSGSTLGLALGSSLGSTLEAGGDVCRLSSQAQQQEASRLLRYAHNKMTLFASFFALVLPASSCELVAFLPLDSCLFSFRCLPSFLLVDFFLIASSEMKTRGNPFRKTSFWSLRACKTLARLLDLPTCCCSQFLFLTRKIADVIV